MSPVPAAAITIVDGEITVDAELLVPKLGLSVAALKAEMRKGKVSNVAVPCASKELADTYASHRTSLL